ncbi:MAG: DUF4258 domain-containing protein [Proteobacteria bacterium]|nr:DUF4258 domain-containing protein [Pseudomonadota bacterium]
MKRSDAQQVIRERAARSELTVLAPNALLQMREFGIDFLDVHRCLSRGKAARGPYAPSDSESNECRYDVEAIVNGEWLRLVVELPDKSPDMVVVTVSVIL